MIEHRLGNMNEVQRSNRALIKLGSIKRVLRILAVATLISALVCVVWLNTAQALNLYRDIFVTLSAKPLAMGGTGAALNHPSSVFYNPAGLANIRQLTLMHNHSARHFPGSKEGGMQEWDQLDGDTQAIVVPLPLSTYAHGFTFSGEMGYDYRGHPADGSLHYPREHYWGTEDYDAWATSTGLPFAIGVSLRRHLSFFTPPIEDRNATTWIRHGEGMHWGAQARIWPGLDYGFSEQRMDYDWLLWEDSNNSTLSAPLTTSSSTRCKRKGWALHPVGWLTLAHDTTEEDYCFDPEAALGSLHHGSNCAKRFHAGGEVCLGTIGHWRWGSYDGHPTYGMALNLAGLRVNFAEVQALLPKIVGSGEGFEDIRIYGAEISLW